MYSWRVPKTVGYGGQGYGQGAPRGPYRIEVETHMDAFEVTQDDAWLTLN